MRKKLNQKKVREVDHSYKVGDILLLSFGEYDDYQVEGVYVTFHEFDAQERYGYWLGKHRVMLKKPEEERAKAFYQWLVKERFIRVLKHNEIHISDDYSKFLGDGVSRSGFGQPMVTTQ